MVNMQKIHGRSFESFLYKILDPHLVFLAADEDGLSVFEWMPSRWDGEKGGSRIFKAALVRVNSFTTGLRKSVVLGRDGCLWCLCGVCLGCKA